jgi:hypothetical protein
MNDARIRRAVAAACAVGLVGAFAAFGSAGASAAGSATAPTGFSPATFADQSVATKRLTAAVQMTKDEQAPTRAFTGPTSMLVDPENPRIVVAATADLRTRVCQLVRSTDAGHTWHYAKSLPAPTAYPNCTNGSAGAPEASIAWGKHGTLYYALNGFGPGEGSYTEGRTSMVLARTTDLGDHWSTTLVDDNRSKPVPAPSDFGATVAVDTSGSRDVVYVGFSQFFPDAPQDSPLNNGPVEVAVSTDGGVTFGPPANIQDSSHLTGTIAGKSYPLLMEGFFGAPLLTAHAGTVVVVSGSESPFNNHPPGDSNFDTRFNYAMPQLAARSTDHGKTWTVATMGPPIYAGVGSQTGLGWTPKGGAKGTFVAAYAGSPEGATSSGVADIVFQRSTDGGATWSDPVAIDDDTSGQSTSFYPQLGVAPNGRVDVVWQDTRGQTDYRVQVRYTYSADGGATWSHNMEVTDQPVNFNLGVSFNSDLRQPPGVASADQYAVFGWADTRLANDLTQTQDNFSAVAQFAAIPAKTSTVLPVVAAVFGGLVVAGALLLLAQLVRRRRRPAPA